MEFSERPLQKVAVEVNPYAMDITPARCSDLLHAVMLETFALCSDGAITTGSWFHGRAAQVFQDQADTGSKFVFLMTDWDPSVKQLRWEVDLSAEPIDAGIDNKQHRLFESNPGLFSLTCELQLPNDANHELFGDIDFQHIAPLPWGWCEFYIRTLLITSWETLWRNPRFAATEYTYGFFGHVNHWLTPEIKDAVDYHDGIYHASDSKGSEIWQNSLKRIVELGDRYKERETQKDALVDEALGLLR